MMSPVSMFRPQFGANAAGKPQVLVVEDDASTRGLMEIVLNRRLGDSVDFHFAENLPEVRSVLDGGEIDAVLTDFSLLDGDGKDVAQYAKALKTPPTKGIFLLSGYSVDSLQDMLGEATKLFDGFLGKPFTVDRLTDLIQTALNGQKKPVF